MNLHGNTFLAFSIALKSEANDANCIFIALIRVVSEPCKAHKPKDAKKTQKIVDRKRGHDCDVFGIRP